MWEDYMPEGPETQEKLLEGARMISTINGQVLEDIEDWIILRAFRAMKLTNTEISKRIEDRLQQQRERAKMQQEKEEKEQEPEEQAMGETLKRKEPVDIFEEGKIEDKNRKFMEPLRPHERIWNFEWDRDERRPKHVLRPEADPSKCYIDGRVEKLLALIDDTGAQLISTDAERWQKLVGHVLDIFKDQEKNEAAAQLVWSNAQNN
jgi:hypothetical protein